MFCEGIITSRFAKIAKTARSCLHCHFHNAFICSIFGQVRAVGYAGSHYHGSGTNFFDPKRIPPSSSSSRGPPNWGSRDRWRRHYRIHTTRLPCSRHMLVCARIRHMDRTTCATFAQAFRKVNARRLRMVRPLRNQFGKRHHKGESMDRRHHST